MFEFKNKKKTLDFKMNLTYVLFFLSEYITEIDPRNIQI